MDQGQISTPPESGRAFDLTRTLQSGETFCWQRELEHGSLFEEHDSGIYITVLPGSVTPTNRPEVLRVAQPSSDTLRWEARMQRAIAEKFGTPVQFDGETYYAFPTPNELATASESALRDLKLGYRAPYVKETAERAVDVHPQSLSDLSYEDAHAELKKYMGVGDKVADCTQLFSLGHISAFPIDTWIETALEEQFPELIRDTYSATARAAREFFGEYTGYAQAYLFALTRSESA